MQQRLCGREQEFGLCIIPLSGRRKKEKPKQNRSRDNRNDVAYPSGRFFSGTGTGIGRELNWAGPSHGMRPHYGHESNGGTEVSEVDKEQERIQASMIRYIPKIVPAISENYGDGFGMWLSNGSRIYRDCELLEIASAECFAGSLDILAQEKATELILNKVAKQVMRSQKLKTISLYKNNVGLAKSLRKEASYGSHHNYSYVTKKRSQIHSIIKNFIPAALPLTGNGHIAKLENRGYTYCFSQKAFHIECIKGEDSRNKRPIINIRDEAHMEDALYLDRLHIISRDATRCEFQTWLVDSITHLVLRLAEEGWKLPTKLQLFDPVQELHNLNSRINFNYKVKTKSGPINIIEYNKIFLRAARQLRPLSAIERKCLQEWGRVLNLFKARAWKKLVGELDWATKKWLIEKKMKQYSFGLNDVRAWKINMEYHNISTSPNQSWFARLDKAGYIKHLISKKSIQRALTIPPETRAKSRGKFVELCLKKKIASQLIVFNWDHAEIDDKKINFGQRKNPFYPNINELEKFIQNK